MYHSCSGCRRVGRPTALSTDQTSFNKQACKGAARSLQARFRVCGGWGAMNSQRPTSQRFRKKFPGCFTMPSLRKSTISACLSKFQSRCTITRTETMKAWKGAQCNKETRTRLEDASRARSRCHCDNQARFLKNVSKNTRRIRLSS